MRVEIPYAPRPQQMEIHDDPSRFRVAVCHRRFGKTVMAINDLIRDILLCEHERPRGAYIAPYYSQAKRVAWDYVQEFCNPLPGYVANQAELRVDLAGGRRIQLYGAADNVDALKGVYLDHVVMDEVAQMPERAWGEVLRPALSDRKGRALFIGTPRGYSNMFHRIWDEAGELEGWNRHMYRASETGIIDQHELDAARREMDPAEYDQEYECSWQAAIVGAYYGRQMDEAEREGRITSVPVDKSARVHTAWDLGFGDDTAIWFYQTVGRELRIVDYYANNGMPIEHYAQVMDEKGYWYGEASLPHDAKPKQLGTGKSIQELLSAAGVKNRVVPMLSIDDGISAVRSVLGRCWFDRKRCEQGIEHLRLYRREWVEKNRAFRQRPVHDYTSHTADAFRYLAVGLRENTRPKREPRSSRPRGERINAGWMSA